MTKLMLRIFLACVAAAFSISSFAADPTDPSAALPRESVIESGLQKTIPLTNWTVDSQSFITQLKTMRQGSARANTKLATDFATIYRPVPICRLLDTRSGAVDAVFNGGGPYLAGSTHTISASGNCNISGEVAGVSLSFHVFNFTVNNGGYITFKTVGAGVSGTNAVFNTGAQWTAATANVSTLDNTGNFDIYIANSNVDVIVDVNGFYQNLDQVDVAGLQMDFAGNTSGDLLELAMNGTGSALTLDGGSGRALTVNSGTIRAAGAGLGTSGFVSIHTVNTAGTYNSGTGTLCAGGFNQYSVINHPMLNNHPTAFLMLQPVEYWNNGAGHFGNYPVVSYYADVGVCTSDGIGHWTVRRADLAAHANSMQYNMVIFEQ